MPNFTYSKTNALFFISVPGKIRFLRLSNSVFDPSHQITISWSKPNAGDDVYQYYVDWYHQNGRQSVYVDHIPGKIKYVYTITSLQFGTQYMVQIYAKNSEGYGIAQSAYILTGTGVYRKTAQSLVRLWAFILGGRFNNANMIYGDDEEEAEESDFEITTNEEMQTMVNSDNKVDKCEGFEDSDM